jgi:hypothetical protein
MIIVFEALFEKFRILLLRWPTFRGRRNLDATLEHTAAGTTCAPLFEGNPATPLLPAVAAHVIGVGTVQSRFGLCFGEFFLDHMRAPSGRSGHGKKHGKHVDGIHLTTPVDMILP